MPSKFRDSLTVMRLLLFPLMFSSFLASDPETYNLIVHVLAKNTSFAALVEPEIRISYEVEEISSGSGSRRFTHSTVDYCDSMLYIREDRIESSDSAYQEIIEGGCSTLPTFIDLNVTAGFYIISAVVRIHNQVVAYSSTAVEVLVQSTARTGEMYRNQYRDRSDPCNRANVINAVISQHGYKSYLEVGVFDGSNYEKIRCAHKECVDPVKRYGKCRPLPGYLRTESCRSPSCNIIRKT
jgi:hypothetical protein